MKKPYLIGLSFLACDPGVSTPLPVGKLHWELDGPFLYLCGHITIGDVARLFEDVDGHL